MNIDKASHCGIKMRLHAVGSSFSQIARELGLTTTTVITASQGRCTSRRVEAAIAKKLETSPEALWPSRYPDKGGNDDPLT